MEEQGVQQRKSKKGKLREVRKANAYGQRLQPSQCVTYASSSSTASSSRAEDGATVTPYSKNSKGIKPQPYLRYVVLDFEATCDKSRAFGPQEIIEFPAVLLNPETLAIESEIQQYVRPVQNPTLTAFCTELTGIQQEWVDKGILLKEAIQGFDKWLADNQVNSFTIVTCGDWDLKTMLRSQCRRERLVVPSYYRNWVNIKDLYEKFYKRRARGGMEGMLSSLRLDLDGRHHCGLDDCKNIAKILRKMIEDGCIVSNTSQIIGDHELYEATENQMAGEEREKEIVEQDTFARRRVTVYKNGVKSNGRGMLIESDNLPLFLQTAGNKLKMKKACKAFALDGQPIESIDQVKKDDEVFISEGEEFIVTHKPEDNFLERPAPEDADLELTWVNIGEGDDKGRFCLYHRPKQNSLRALKNNGCTHVVTLLSHKEKGQFIGGTVESVGLKWVWLPLVNGNPPKDTEIEAILQGINKMVAALTEEHGSLLIHCSAGIHRTGMITNALLMYMGLSAEEAKTKIMQARKITGEGVGDHRLAWGTTFVAAVGTYNSPKTHQ